MASATATAASSASSLRHVSALAVAGNELQFFAPDAICRDLARVYGRRRAHPLLAGPNAKAAGVRNLCIVGLRCNARPLGVADSRRLWTWQGIPFRATSTAREIGLLQTLNFLCSCNCIQYLQIGFLFLYSSCNLVKLRCSQTITFSRLQYI